MAHLHRAKYIPNGGPDGGDGGKGGDIILRGNRNYWTLLHLKYQRHIFAGNGQNGGINKSTGADGESKIVELEIPYRSFHMWDKDMKFRVEEGWFSVWLGKNAEQVIESRRVYVK